MTEDLSFYSIASRTNVALSEYKKINLTNLVPPYFKSLKINNGLQLDRNKDILEEKLRRNLFGSMSLRVEQMHHQMSELLIYSVNYTQTQELLTMGFYVIMLVIVTAVISIVMLSIRRRLNQYFEILGMLNVIF